MFQYGGNYKEAVYKVSIYLASKLAQWIQALVARPDILSLILGTHTTDGGFSFLQVVT